MPSTPPPRPWVTAVGRKLGKAQAPIRVAVTGRRVGPPLFEALEVLGPDRTLATGCGRALERPGETTTTPSADGA